MPEQKIYLDDNGNPMPPPKVYLDENGNPLGAAAGPQPSALEALKAQVATYPKDIGSSTGFTSAFTGSVPPEKQTGPMAAVGRLARSPLDMLKMAAAPADPSKGELETPGAPIGLQRVIGSQVGLLASGLKGLTRTPDPDAIGTQTRMNAGQPSPRDLENLHAAGETLAGATPLAGPWAANMGERAGRGDLSGTATEFAGGLAAPKALHGVIDLAKDASGAYSVPKPKALAPAASPAESVNPLQAYHAASEHGIDMLPAQVSDSRVAKIADSIGKRAVFDLGDLKGKGERQNIALSKWHQDAGNQVDPGGTAQNTESIGRDLQAGAEARYAAEKAAVAARGPNVPGVASTIMDGMAPRASAEEVAGKVQNRLQATVAQLGHQADSIFGDLDTKARGVTVAASNGQKLAQKIIQENGSYYEKFPSVAPTQALKLLQRIASTDKPLTFTEAQKLRSDALELARNNPDIFKGKPAG
ncbi:MAG TPA: hypothetical protein VGR03_01945, partial [Candidatus Acidoferrum sp.]|nr:hypothetical protein [Candidatus Acidoferrum sp.]